MSTDNGVQVLQLALRDAAHRLRRHADICSRYGESDVLRAEADRLEALAAADGATPAQADEVLWEGPAGLLSQWAACNFGPYAPRRVRVVATPATEGQ